MFDFLTVFSTPEATPVKPAPDMSAWGTPDKPCNARINAYVADLRRTYHSLYTDPQLQRRLKRGGWTVDELAEWLDDEIDYYNRYFTVVTPV